MPNLTPTQSRHIADFVVRLQALLAESDAGNTSIKRLLAQPVIGPKQA